MGLMQLMPETAARFGVRDPFNPRTNIDGGVRYLRFLLDRFNYNLAYALAAYNAGEKVVDERGDVPPYEETRTYIKRVTTLYGQLKDQNPQQTQRAVYRTVDRGRVVYTNTD
jgi:soluble lytic murein transglycosylase-like protein